MEREALNPTRGQAVSRCQAVTRGVITVITVHICLLPLECHSRRTRPASLTWSGERETGVNFAWICRKMVPL